MKALKVLDTNIILLDANNIHNLASDGSVIILPETVVNELDSFKSGHSELAYQSRSFGRLIASATRIGKEEINDLRVIKMKTDTTEIWIVSSVSYPDMSQVDPKTINDRKIIEIAYQLLANNDGDVTFYTNDIMCGITAEALGLRVKELRDVENTDFVFTKELEVSTEVFSNLHNKPILDIDSEYKFTYHNYKFTTLDSTQVKLATITNGLVTVMGKDSERDIRRQEVNPCNSEQLLLSKAIQDPMIDIVVCDSLAGSGKDLVSISNAIRLVKTNTPYESIHYIRASVNDVPVEEEVGFLAGNEEKMAVYLHPLYDTLDFIARQRYTKSKLKGAELEEKVDESIEKYMKDCSITAMTALGLRGRTFHNTVAIIDESQNMSKASLQKVLTRFGRNCKIIIIGSSNQIDNKFLTKYTNGLSVLLNACTEPQELVTMRAVTLQKVPRGAIAEFAENLFSVTVSE